MTKKALIRTVQDRLSTYLVQDVIFARNNLFNMITGPLKRDERIGMRG